MLAGLVPFVRERGGRSQAPSTRKRCPYTHRLERVACVYKSTAFGAMGLKPIRCTYPSQPLTAWGSFIEAAIAFINDDGADVALVRQIVQTGKGVECPSAYVALVTSTQAGGAVTGGIDAIAVVRSQAADMAPIQGQRPISQWHPAQCDIGLVAASACDAFTGGDASFAAAVAKTVPQSRV